MIFTRETFSNIIGRRPSMRDKSTQHDCGHLMSSNFPDLHHFVTHPASTTSSSQTESNIFLPKQRHIENPPGHTAEHITANVVRIHLGPNENYENSTNGINGFFYKIKILREK